VEEGLPVDAEPFVVPVDGAAQLRWWITRSGKLRGCVVALVEYLRRAGFAGLQNAVVHSVADRSGAALARGVVGRPALRW
jgi:hypothetical protein